MVKDPLWKVTDIKRTGTFIGKLDDMFNLLSTEKNFKFFCFSFIRLGDHIKYTWQYMYVKKVFEHKLSFYDISTTKKKDTIIIKIKRKTEKAFVAEKVAEKV